MEYRSPQWTLTLVRLIHVRKHKDIFIFYNFLNSEMAQVIEIFPHERQGPINTAWLLMTWWCEEPGLSSHGIYLGLLEYSGFSKRWVKQQMRYWWILWGVQQKKYLWVTLMSALWLLMTWYHFNLLVPERRNSIANPWSYVFLALTHGFGNRT